MSVRRHGGDDFGINCGFCGFSEILFVYVGFGLGIEIELECLKIGFFFKFFYCVIYNNSVDAI